ncbi:MAG TPA: hypothetical protein PKE56_16620, partial [Acidimicrobiales bacterium]|nr:hypothetical protein [Acidimicrobiales bacterium]
NSENGYSRWPAYGQSKLANLLFTPELARRAEAAGTNLIAAASHDLALRYREADAWRELAQAYAERTGTLAPPGLRRVPGPTAPADQTAGGDDDLTGP